MNLDNLRLLCILTYIFEILYINRILYVNPCLGISAQKESLRQICYT